MDNGQITPSILNMCENALASLPPFAFVVVALVCYFLIACLIPSSTGLAAATMGIMGTLSTFAGVDVYIMVIIYLMALGLAKMITPCSIVVMTCTAASSSSTSTCWAIARCSCPSRPWRSCWSWRSLACAA